MNFKSKLKDTGTSIFAVMTALANEQGAINLSQGFPDFTVDAQLIDNVDFFMRAGFNQYPPMPGVAHLREKISLLTKEFYGREYDIDKEITVTSGATEALFAAITATVDSDDEVIVFDPAYDSYVPSILLNKGIPVYIPLTFPSFKIDWDLLKSKITGKTKLIMLNFPHNPTGSTLHEDDLNTLTEIIRDKNIFIISDEVYEHIVFDGKQHQSVIRFPELADRSFVISSFGKTFHITGWKVGYCQAPVALTAEFRKVHQFLTYATSAPFQYAIAKYLEDFDKVHTVKKMYEQKRNYFLGLIKNSRFKPLHSEGTYFQTLDYSEITDERDTDFAVKVTKEFGVASIPISVFYSDKKDYKLLRFCFAKNDETLKTAAERLCRI
jgi:methionine aminotransferase